MAKKRDAFIDAYNPDDPDLNFLSTVKFKILTSLKNHWDGLSVFVEHKVDEQSSALLEKAMDRFGLSARAHARILKIARTIADLENQPDIMCSGGSVIVSPLGDVLAGPLY